MYKKYYGVFAWVNDELYGVTYDHKKFSYGPITLYNNYVLMHYRLYYAEKMLEEVKKIKEIIDFCNSIFIMKVSGRYFTPVLKKYGQLYTLDWKQYKYALKLSNINQFYKRNMCFKKISI